jgi:hypothetical protein
VMYWGCRRRFTCSSTSRNGVNSHDGNSPLFFLFFLFLSLISMLRCRDRVLIEMNRYPALGSDVEENIASMIVVCGRWVVSCNYRIGTLQN